MWRAWFQSSFFFYKNYKAYKVELRLEWRYVHILFLWWFSVCHEFFCNFHQMMQTKDSEFSIWLYVFVLSRFSSLTVKCVHAWENSSAPFENIFSEVETCSADQPSGIKITWSCGRCCKTWDQVVEHVHLLKSPWITSTYSYEIHVQHWSSK